MRTHLCCAVIWGLSLVGTTGRAAEKPLVVTTLPFANAAEQQAVFAILNRYLSNALGRPVVFTAGSSYDTTIEALALGKTDIAFLGAVSYIKARRRGDVRAILRTIRGDQPTYRGVILVPKGSPVRTLAGLKGRTVAFVDRSSGGGYLFPRLLLRGAGLDPDRDLKTVFAGGHHQVVRMVAEGKADAGACFAGAERTLADPSQVVTLAQTEPVPGDPVVVRAGLGSELIKRLRSALMEMPSVPDARGFFTFAEIDGFVPAFDSDYDRMAELVRLSD